MRYKQARLLAAATAAAVAATLAACSSDAAPPCLTPSSLPPSLTLGTGEVVFEPLVEAGTIRAYQGPQGGFHVLLWVRATGIYPGAPGDTPSSCDDPEGSGAPCISFSVTDLTAGGTISAYAPLHLPLECTPGEGAYQPAAPRLVILDIDSLADVDGHQFEIRGTVADTNGVTLEERVTVLCTL